MKNSILTFVTLLVTTLAFAQIPNWSWAYNYECFNNDTRGMTTVAPNGDVYLIGNFNTPSAQIGTTTLTNSGPVNSGDMYIIKYSSDGTLLWVKREGSINFDYVVSITTDSNGNFYLLGNFAAQITIGTTTLNHLYNSFFLAKYNPDGDFIWAKAVGSNSETCVVNKIKADAQGNIYMTGMYRSPTATFDSIVLTNDNYDANTGGNTFIAKYNSSGNVVWAKGNQRTSSTAFTDISYDMAFDNAGNVYIGGAFFSSTMSFDGITINNPQSPSTTFFIAKFDANGNALWAKAPTSNNPNHYIWAASTDSSGNVYFSGAFRGTMTLDANSITASSSGNKMFVLKCNSNGVSQWFRTATSNGYSAVESTDVDSAGYLYVTGTFSDSTINFGGGVFGSSSTTGALYVLKYSPSGTPVWARTVPGFNINSRISIDCFNQNEIYVGGHFFGTSATFGATTITQVPDTNNDVFIAKLLYVPLGVNDFDAHSLVCYPNPVADELQVPDLDSSYSYSVIDGMGKTLDTGELNALNHSILFSEYAAGIYWLQIDNEQGKSIVKRIVKK